MKIYIELIVIHFVLFSETPINCTATIHQTNGSLCLWLVKDVKTWQDADDDCAVHGGYLVAVTSPEINDVVYSIMKNNSLSSVWLGVTEKVSTWKWLKGRRIFRFREWSLITGRGGGGYKTGGGGAREVLHLRKRGGGRKSFSHSEGGGGTTSFGVDFTR